MEEKQQQLQPLPLQPELNSNRKLFTQIEIPNEIIQRGNPYALTTQPLDQTNLPTLHEIYTSYSDRLRLHHWYEYSFMYEKNIDHLRYLGRPVKLLEFGVHSGGSIVVWKKYFGESLQYVGVDINPSSAQFTNPNSNIHVFTGSQANISILETLCDKYGPFDFVVDDGGHTTELIVESLRYIWNSPKCLQSTAVYVMEDLHAVHMGPRWTPVDVPDIYAVMGDMARNMSSYFAVSRGLNVGSAQTDAVSGHIKYMELYDSVAILHYSRERMRPLTQFRKGSFSV